MKIFIYTFIFLILISKAFTEDILRWSFELINHGARTPHKGLDSNSKDFMNHLWIGENELTGVGLRQSFLIGYRDRLRYIGQHNLIAEEYDPRDILIYATENNRTLMSASALLHGLFIPGTGPQIDPDLVYRAVPPVDEDSYINEKNELDNDNFTALPGRMNLVPVHIFFDHEYITQYETSKKCIGLKYYEKKNQKRDDVKNFLKDMTKKYGDNLVKNIFKNKKKNILEDYEFAYNFFDTIICLYFDGAVEFNTILNVLNVKEEELINDCYKFLNLNTVGNGIDNDKDFIDYLVSSIFEKIIGYMDYRIEKDLKGEENYKGYDLPKYFILSGVTNTCGSFMSFMNKYFGTKIKYANFSTNIHLELFLENTTKSNITEKNYRLEYYYNDEFLLSIPYTEFKNKIISNLISNEEINKFCKEEKEDDDDDTNWYLYGTIIAAVIALILIVIIIILLRKRAKNSGTSSTEVEDKGKLLRDTNRSSTEQNNQNNNENSE